MKWCSSCILPDTRPNLQIGADGVCNACTSAALRPQIDWAERRRKFESVVSNAKRRSGGYDCVIPVSGGKDSTWQVVTCLRFGLNPLTVTWRPPGRTRIGQENLDNLISLGVDHIDYTIDPSVERKFMLEALRRYGSTALPMHLAMFNIPLKIAAKFEIPLVVWGENSAAEYGGDEDSKGFALTEDWIRRYGVTQGTTADDWVSESLSREELTPYYGPDPQELESKSVLAIFLGYYFPWDPVATYEVARASGFKTRSGPVTTGYYDYADIDDHFISIHHHLKWYKFGFTRLFDNLSLEIRNGRMSRPEAIEIVRERGDQTPHEDMRVFCTFTGIAESELFEIMEDFRNLEIWTKQDGVWKIPEYLISDWDWRRSSISVPST